MLFMDGGMKDIYILSCASAQAHMRNAGLEVK